MFVCIRAHVMYPRQTLHIICSYDMKYMCTKGFVKFRIMHLFGHHTLLMDRDQVVDNSCQSQ